MDWKNQNQMNNMKNLFLILFLFSLLPLSSFGQLTLTIEIDGLQNNDGQVLLEFSNEKGEKIRGISQNIADHKCIIVINNLDPGKYAFKYFHDKNKNEKLDLKWMVIPKEGYGFSNNAKGTFGPPSLEKMVFEIKGNATLQCTPTYLKF